MNKIKFFSAALLLGAVVATPMFALAQYNGLPTDLAPEPSSPWTGPTNLLLLLDYIARFMFTIFLVMAVIMFLAAAFFYLTAAGNDATLKKAHGILIWGVVGIAVALISFGIVQMVQGLLSKGTF